jgi:hypothetical protein
MNDGTNDTTAATNASLPGQIIGRSMKGAWAAGLARKPVFWAGAILLVLPFVLFWPVWWPNEDLRRSFAFGDFVQQYYPMRAFVAGEWRAGRLPLWDPYTYSGTPAAAASLFAAFYPLGIWLAFFPVPFPFIALETEAILHLGLGGLFTLLFVRRLTGSTGGGLIAGLGFSLGGFLTSYPLLQLGILETAVWLPMGLWLVEGSLAERDVRRAALAGVAFAISLLAGHPQTFLYIAYLAVPYFLLRALRLKVGWNQTAFLALVLGGITMSVSAVQWLPSLELARLSPRAALSYEAASNGFQPSELWGVLRPNQGEWSPLYIGWIPLVLAAVAVVRRHGESWFWLTVAAVAAALALGRNGFLYPLVHGVVPGLANFRNQERAALLVSFSLAVLAGYGYSALVTSRIWPNRARLAIVTFPVLLIGLTFGDLYRTNFGLAFSPGTEVYFPKTRITEHLSVTGSADWRTSTEGLLPGDGNAGQVYRLRDVTGNSPLHLAGYDSFLNEVPETRFWQLLNVQHLLTKRELKHGAALPVLEEHGVRLYQIFGAQPAWIVHDYRLVTGPDDALAATADPGLDPLSTVVLEHPPNVVPAAPTSEEDARLVEFSQQDVVLEATLSTPGIVVSSEVHYPGWVARVNGNPAQTLRAYGLLRAVALPAGTWRVEWRYEPVTVRVGSALSLTGLGITAGLLWFQRRRSLHSQERHAQI